MFCRYLVLSFILAVVFCDGETSDKLPCDYPNIDFLSDRIVDHMASLIPPKLDVPDDTKGTTSSKNSVVFGLDGFYRINPSTYECTDKGLLIKIPLKFSKPVSSEFEISPNWKLKTWIPVEGVINHLETEAIIEVVFIGEPEVHLTSLQVTTVRDVELGIRGRNIFARAFRKLTSLIANEFKGRIKRFIEKNLQEILTEKMIIVPLKDLGFN